VCQTATRISVFPALDELLEACERSLAAHPDDAAALAIRGEIRLHLGEESVALDDLRKALSIENNPHARELLVAALIEGLRTDFAAYRGRVGEIEGFVTDPQQQRRFRRLYAQGLQDAGEYEAAFRQFLQFAASIPQSPDLERISPDWSVREDRWSRGRLTALWESSDDPQRNILRLVLDDAIAEVLSGDDPAQIAALLEVVPDSTVADRLRFEWAERVSPPDQLPLLESRLLKLIDSASADQRAYAVARLADMWLARGQAVVLLPELLTQLEGPLSNVVCLDGQTGAELIEGWRTDETRAAHIDPAPIWPIGPVAINDEARVGTAGQLFAVPILGRPSELLRGWTFFTDAQGTNVVAFDEQGRRMWHIPSGSLNRRGRNSEFVRYVMTHGRLVLIAVEDQFTILDALSGGQTVEILANERLTPDADQSPFIVNLQRGNGAVRLRNRVWMDPQNGTTAIGNVGPLNGDTFVFQSGHSLRAIDPFVGTPLWTREVHDLNPGGDILSDDEYVVVWPATGPEFSLFRSADGDFLGRHAIPASVVKPQPDGHWGRMLVCFERSPSGNNASLGLYDPAREQYVWRREFAGLADWNIVDGCDFSVLLQDGTLLVLSGVTGDDLLMHSLSTDPLPERATVTVGRDRYFVMTYATPQGSTRVVEASQPQFPPVHGVVVALDRRGGDVLWSQPVTHQQFQADTPGEWPVLAFAAQVIDPNPGPNGRAGGRFWALRLLDKQTGNILYETEVNGRQDKRGWESSPERHELAIAAGTARVGLRFADSESNQDPEPHSP
jgi:tetratricopeptide (TPR) repeat protein